MTKNSSGLTYLVVFILFSFLGTLEFLFGGKYYDQAIYAVFNLMIPFKIYFGFVGMMLLFIQDKLSKINLGILGLINGIAITIWELVSGLLTLLIFKMPFWDYSTHFLNFNGIISLPMFFVWTAFGYLFSLIYLGINKLRGA